MDTFALLGAGFLTALQPLNLLYAAIGVTLGTAVGVLPGIGPATTVALLLPVTYKLDPGGSLIMFAGIYYGGMYGGSTTSILLNTPGESASIVTALEGNKMARAGRGGPALATAAIGSFVAGLIATVALAFIAPWIVKFALSFGPAEYFALMVLAFVTVSAAFGDSALRGLSALFVGLTLGHGMPHLFRATIEGICFGTRAILDGMRGAGFTATEITIGGGATSSDLWLQIHADTAGLPVSVPASTEAPSLGAAILAGVGAGHFASIEEGMAAMVRPGRRIEPRPRESALYDDLYRRYAQLYPALKPFNPARA